MVRDQVLAVVKAAEGVEVWVAVVRVQVRAAIAFAPIAAQRFRTGQGFHVILYAALSAEHKW